MPKIEYKCQQCGEKFEYSKGLFERENKIKCPKCGSQNLKKSGFCCPSGSIHQPI